MTILIFCQAGPGIGLGHLSRCIVAAGALADAGLAPRLLIQGPELQREDLELFPHTFIPQDAPLLEAVAWAAKETKANAVVFDLQPRLVPAGMDLLLAGLRAAGRRTVAIDGMLEHARNLDLMFIPSFRFTPPQDLPPDANVLSGWDCYLLDPARGTADWRPGKRVLALTGGSDITGLGATWPRLLDMALPVDTKLDWVTGPYAPQPVWPAHPRIGMTNHQAPQGLSGLMANANYALTIFGVSFFELLWHGVPTVVFSPYGGKDDGELAGVAATKAALVASNEGEAVAMLHALMADGGQALALSRAARQLLSTPGGERFARAVGELWE